MRNASADGPGEKGSSSMIRSMWGRAIRVLILPAALTLALGLTTQAQATPSQVCGNGGSGYCLNDWGGAGHSGDVIKMFNGGTTNDDFFVQKVNRCSGSGYRRGHLEGQPNLRRVRGHLLGRLPALQSLTSPVPGRGQAPVALGPGLSQPAPAQSAEVVVFVFAVSVHAALRVAVHRATAPGAVVAA